MMVPGSKNGSSGNHTTLAEINVTPFVDVMLVLLIVFMVSAPLMQQGLEINLPKAEGTTLEEGPDPIVVTVTAERLARVGPHDLPFVQVSVHDTGAGIPPETQAQLFQKFVTGTHRARGSGLGLAFCRLTIEAHGGRIWVESEIGKGSAFIFEIPLKLGK